MLGDKVKALKTPGEIGKNISIPDLTTVMTESPSLVEQRRDFNAKIASELVDGVLAKIGLSALLPYSRDSSLNQSVSTNEIIDNYLTYMADSGAAEGYLKVRARKLRSFTRQYPELPLSPEPICVYLRQFKTADVPTRQDQWKALSALYKFASDTSSLPNPMLKVEKPRFKKKPGQRMSRDQAKIFLSVVDTDLEWGLVTCYFGLRFRRVEAERILCGDIKSDYMIVRGKERTEEFPLLPVFREKLLILHTDQGPNDPLFSIKADTMAYHIGRIFRRSGIEGVRGSPHTLRNTAGALWSAFGGDWTSNRQLLRHSATTMTDHYSHSTIDELLIKDQKHNPMLNLMRELGLVPAPDRVCLNTTGGQARNMPSSMPS